MATGCVYIFVRSGSAWNLQQKLKPSDASAGDRFGAAVSIIGDRVVVGAPFLSGLRAEGSPSPTPGKAYVFERSGTSWVERKKLVAPDGNAGDQFGASVSLAPGTIAVGAPYRNVLTGAAYIFSGAGSSWALQQKLTPPTSGNFCFGYTSALSGKRLAVGSPCNGSVSVFERDSTSWILRAGFAADVSTDFAAGIGLTGSALIVGAPSDNSRAYIFQDDQIFADSFQ